MSTQKLHEAYSVPDRIYWYEMPTLFAESKKQIAVCKSTYQELVFRSSLGTSVLGRILIVQEDVRIRLRIIKIRPLKFALDVQNKPVRNYWQVSMHSAR